MNFVFLMLLMIMLVVFGYAQLQKDVVRTPGRINMNEEEEIEFR
jgi:hypothetical protein